MVLGNPLAQVYGEGFDTEGSGIIRDLAKHSNIPFDAKYIELGVSFAQIKAQEILEGKREKPSLHVLLSESFGEAAIYKYNVAGGTL